MIHHIFPGNQVLHVPYMIDILNQYSKEIGVSREEQVFYCIYRTPERHIGKYNSLGLPPERLKFIKSTKLESSLMNHIKKNDLLIFHSVFYRKIWFFLSNHPWVLKNTALLFWGGDVLKCTVQLERDVLNQLSSVFNRETQHPQHWKSIIRISWNLVKIFKRFLSDRIHPPLYRSLLSRLGAICTGTPGEFKMISQLHGPCHNYVPIVFHTNTMNLKPTPRKEPEAALRVLLGNSGKLTNEHLEVLSWLSAYKDENIKVICPLGYPQQSSYKDKVIEKGRRLLKDKFVPLMNIIPKSEYNSLLASIDIVISNAKRQQGLYCVYSSLLYGKKVYLSAVSPVYEMMTKWGIKVFDVHDIISSSFQEFSSFSQEDAKRNHRIGQEHFSLQACLKSFKALIAKMRQSVHAGERYEHEI